MLFLKIMLIMDFDNSFYSKKIFPPLIFDLLPPPNSHGAHLPHQYAASHGLNIAAVLFNTDH
jgi:hypothetical protein